MYIDNENFEKWMAKLSTKLTEIGQDLKSLINTDTIFDENDKILDNQDLAFLLKVSFRTLQRYRASGKLPFFMISHKTYYRASDIRAFVQENADSKTYERFKKENQLDTQTKVKQGGNVTT
ncbi:helix-turn-helix domain-containing protein [Bacteroides salyersiae]|uniref:helix-turn-helix domain-containing protein n=1 Tax=Bacteroides salyersiae TaxID=291644 RepID=UPI00221EFDEB|nr:helix-turn-helix domain-containing protein [Bacteroides salyersiae]UYU39488.1 helix-turn-helix domain-containing protein [Bacteroides salyersiae]